jgi:translation initiation factor IF-3
LGGARIEREPRVNEKIRAREVRVIGPNGEQLGVMTVRDALIKAQEAELDLVEVAPTSVPPVCRIIDYGKYKYEQQKKARGQHHRAGDIKGMRFSPKIGEHDFQVKARHVHEFLQEGNKVRASVWFRGREMAYPKAGEKLLGRLAEIVGDVGMVERPPLLEGRNMIMILTPKKG